MSVTTTHLLFFFLGFITDFSSLAEFYLLRDLGLDVASCYLAATVINLPWALRPIWGFLSDRVGRRNIQLSFVFFFAFIIWMILRGVRDATTAIALLTLCEVAPASGLTIADVYAVKLTKSDPGAMPKHHRYRIVGKVLSSFASGKILSAYGTNHDTIAAIFLAQGLLFLVCVPICIFFLPQDTHEYKPVVTESTPQEEVVQTHRCAHTREVFKIAWENKEIRYTIIIFTIFAAFPDAGMSFMYFLVGPLKISPLTLATAEAARGVSDFAGTFVNPHVSLTRAMSANLSIINVLCIPMMALVCRSVSNLIDDRLILILSSCIAAWLGSAFATIYTINVAKASPEGREGGVYNGIISIPSIGQVIGVVATFGLTHFYEIDHDHFLRLPEFIFTTSIAGCVVSLIAAPFFSSRAPSGP